MRSFRLFLAFCLAALAASAAGGSADAGPTFAIRGVKIFPVSGPVVEKGTLVFRDGLIEAVGPMEKVAIPEDAEIVEGEGLTAYPGLISSHTNLFLEEARPAQPQSPADFAAAAAQPSQPDQPDLWVFRQIKTKKTTLDAFLKSGITTALVAPQRGIFQGQSVLLNLNGEEPAPMVVRNPFALHINFTTARGGYPSSLMGTIAYIRQKFLDAEYFADARAVYAKNLRGMARPVYDPFAEALGPFVRDKRPVVFQCNNAEEIKRALRIVEEFKLNALLSHANEAWRDAAVLKKTPLPLLVTLDFRPPRTSRYASQGEETRRKAEAEVFPANPARLAKEGLKFALTSLGIADGGAAIKAVQGAIKAGLSHEEALRALTLQPAEFLGVSAQLGSLETGKIANVVLSKGDPFDEKAQIVRVFVDGIPAKF
jgi:imidazolonepropionase-like amidohydrolase